MDDWTDQDRQTWWWALGLFVGVVLGAWLWGQRRTGVSESDLARRWSAPTNAGARVATALRADPVLSQQPIDVKTLSDGVVELSGSASTRAEADRAVRIAQNTSGVFTVVNRLEPAGGADAEDSPEDIDDSGPPS